MLHAEGPLLAIDVSTCEVMHHDIDPLLQQTIGGRATATYLAHDRIPFDADPFGPDNRIYLSTGPLQLSQMSFTGRMNMTGLSPLTNGLVSTNAGGYLSRNFANTGISVLEVTGSSDELIAIHVRDDDVWFESIPELEEATVPEVSDHMTEAHDLGPEHCIAIGPAGEHLVRYASVLTFNSRAFGRGGLGAALGAKGVKCVTFDGETPPDIEIPTSVTSTVHREAAQSDSRMKRQGTTGGTEFINDNFSLPTRYFSERSFEHVTSIGGDAVEEKKYKRGTCSMCAFGCKLPTRDEKTGLETEGPEFETVYAFGSNQGVGDIVDVMKSNKLCDDLGLDTISAGVTIAAYLASEDEFGNAGLVHELIEKVAYRDGIGDLLAEGVHRIADDLGVDDMTAKGMEFAGHDGRELHGLGLQYAVANRGGDHMYATFQRFEYRGEVDPEGTTGKASKLIEQEQFCAFRDSAIICAFSGDHLEEDRLEAIFAVPYERLLEVGNGVIERERHFNNQRGMDIEDDQLPYELPDLEASKQEYYHLRGWTDRGVVPDDRIEQTQPPMPPR